MRKTCAFNVIKCPQRPHSSNKDLIVETTSRVLKRLFVVSKAYLPLQYPLLFPRGEPGYTNDIPLKDVS